MTTLIIAIIALITSIIVLGHVAIETTEWGKSELIDNIKTKRDEKRNKREAKY